ncbi:Clavaminate synthase-like protein [Fomitopsis serialis]|uniref:Clavaminate synthase-like protein n=1 Tax=Fomitopsis serialis TaxID=139415 RepID=UPI002008C66C|nr:Clavaminate synthase-like protein [Neoantrodia serialis]KAH9921819.1 Clavaminate synthase-like protein [Neoantrodia serialis]
MPSVVLPPIAHYVPASPTKEPYLSKADTYEGRVELAAQLRDAMHTHGFFYVINHGLTQAENERIFDIADVPFSAVSDEEKKAYVAKIKETGSWQGYKLKQYWHINAGVHDQIEHYNINNDVTRRQHPQAVRPLIPEIEAFVKFNHFNILHPLLRLFALGLELPEETFVNVHKFKPASETFDFGSVSILWSQPVASLQIMYPDGSWRNIKHIDNALVVNAGDALEFLSGGFYKGTIHRRGYTRLGIFYFALPDDDTKLVPFAESPVLQRVGIQRRWADADAPTSREWDGERTRAYGQSELKVREKGVEEEIINGVVVKHWN